MKANYLMPTGEIITREALPAFKTPYNHDRDFESERTGSYNAEPSLTKQEFKEESDMNVILQRFLRGGEPPPIVLPEHFADITGRIDYFTMQTKIAEANASFYLLPAETRTKHLNDPARWADAVVKALNSRDIDGLNELGIAITARPPETAEGGTPPSTATPAPTTSQKPSQDPKGDPKTDNPK